MPLSPRRPAGSFCIDHSWWQTAVVLVSPALPWTLCIYLYGEKTTGIVLVGASRRVQENTTGSPGSQHSPPFLSDLPLELHSTGPPAGPVSFLTITDLGVWLVLPPSRRAGLRWQEGGLLSLGPRPGGQSLSVISKQGHYALSGVSSFRWVACGCHGYGFVPGGL